MYEYLAPGTARRTFTDSNLALINTDADRFMKAAVPPMPGTQVTPLLGAVLSAQPAATLPSACPAELVLDRTSENSFGGMTFPASMNAPKDSLAAATPGLDGDDSVLVGGAGNDVVIGGQGRNLMAGGFGFDHFTSDHASGQARDQVFAFVGPEQALNWFVEDGGWA
jgi:Ca2+-binding RTX toxin-like protein